MLKMSSREFNASLFKQCFGDLKDVDLDRLANTINGINRVLDSKVRKYSGYKCSGDYR